ncbi:MAG: hypothetical protein M3257_07050 [Actinomycetota bacterium]|nr:hypothetical protein [Actinomycetota bacterium]
MSLVGGCERPIRLAGHLHTINPTTGEVLASRSTETLPDGVIYVSCGDRRASVCPACAETYRADTYHLIHAGLVGGKGVPDTITTHSGGVRDVHGPRVRPGALAGGRPHDRKGQTLPDAPEG